MSVQFAPVLDALPTSSDVHDRLSITSVAPVSLCSVCDNNEPDGGSNTVFEMAVFFFHENLDYRAKLAGVNSSFRHPPVFMKFAVDGTHERDKHVSKRGVVGPLVPS